MVTEVSYVINFKTLEKYMISLNVNIHLGHELQISELYIELETLKYSFWFSVYDVRRFVPL